MRGTAGLPARPGGFKSQTRQGYTNDRFADDVRKRGGFADRDAGRHRDGHHAEFCAGAGRLGCNVTLTGFGLWSIAAPVTASTPMPTTPPTRTLPANPAAPAPATSLVSGITCGW